LLETERWIDQHRVTEDDGGVPTPEMRPVVLVRQIRFCGLGVVIGVVVALLSPWTGIAIVAGSLGLMATLIARFRRS
jgi:hypothetical protein